MVWFGLVQTVIFNEIALEQKIVEMILLHATRTNYQKDSIASSNGYGQYNAY